MKKVHRKTGVLLLGALVTALITAGVFIASCGSEYEKPSTTQTPTALISAQTLQEWIDKGLVNGTGYDKVVIVHVGNSASYFTTGHIPGALYLDSGDISQARTEGIAGSNYEVLEGLKMDALIQKFGIDGNTTIVFTGSSLLYPARAYFTFRYWGFPKSRLKVLDGANVTWATTYTAPPYALVTTNPPEVAASTYSVRNNGALRDDLRVSLPEMIAYAEGKVPNALAVDTRDVSGTVWSYGGLRGSTGSNFAGCIAPTTCTDYAVFEGRIRGSKALDYTLLYDGATYIVDPVAQLITDFTAIGLDSSKTAYIYCRFGFQGSVAFFVLDGVLGWPVAFYDGSWSQWGQLSGNTSMKGQLNASSLWRTDIPSRSELIAYNFGSVGPAGFFGAGLNDVTTSGSAVANYNLRVEIDGIGTPDTFRWSSDGGTTWTASGVAITGVAQTLIESVAVTFTATTGHTLNDYWIFTAGPIKNVEQLTADGSVCSATYLTTGTITNSLGGTTACTNAPTSFDVNPNRIEDADKAYMGSGGSGGGGGGGGSIPGGC